MSREPWFWRISSTLQAHGIRLAVLVDEVLGFKGGFLAMFPKTKSATKRSATL